ncbi:hypothetical protein SNR37_000016 [Agarivorans aestuarii]|uniref:Uncharacterized protein n=1 Tax=Agarivorans aestuarii TaxID=1563703 RepID=A0ABU7FZ86_9ALTE|nr:hypothetical protein [Agarivorans aestuarii]MEE1672249.1 hypothetical protein [Agarivorans aestuarii]
MKQYLLAAVLCLTSSFSYAEMVDKTGASISVVYVSSGGDYLMQLEGVSGWLRIGEAGNPNADALYSTALAAKLNNQSNVRVRYWTNDTDPTEFPTVGIIAIH